MKIRLATITPKVTGAFMMARRIGKTLVTEFGLVVRNEEGGVFKIEPSLGAPGWLIGYSCHRGHFVLVSRTTAEPMLFNGPEQCMHHCGSASEADGSWRRFRRQVGKRNFGKRLAVQNQWKSMMDAVP